MTISLKRLIGIFFLYFIFSCRKDSDPLILNISPLGLNQVAKAGSIIEFRLSGSGNSPIINLKVISKLKNSPEKITLDSIFKIPSKKISFSYFYSVPEYLEDTSTIITFEIIDQAGNSFQVSRQLLIYVEGKQLTETTSYQIFPKNSENLRSGFNLETLTYGTIGVTDSSLIDIYDPSISDTLTLTWKSMSGGKFVRFNDFNYSAATNITLKEAYSSGVKLDLINNLKVGDIVLFFRKSGQTENYAAIKLLNVVNSKTDVEKYYFFNVKK